MNFNFVMFSSGWEVYSVSFENYCMFITFLTRKTIVENQLNFWTKFFFCLILYSMQLSCLKKLWSIISNAKETLSHLSSAIIVRKLWRLICWLICKKLLYKAWNPSKLYPSSTGWPSSISSSSHLSSCTSTYIWS